MINVFKSIGYSLIGLALLGWISLLLIITMYAQPGDIWLTQFVADNIIMSEQLESFNRSFSDVSDSIFNLLATKNLTLLLVSILFAIGWSIGSHYLNIDSPGKAKIYFIHWVVFSLIFLGLVAGVSIFFLTNTNFDNDFISDFGVFFLTMTSLIYYFLIYYMGVFIGTARFARSSVLFANKLPGGF